jgi:hypothetical protein
MKLASFQRATAGLASCLATCLSTCLSWGLAMSDAAAQTPNIYYVCPGNVFTNTITAKEAEARGCKAREAQQPTTIAGPKPKPVAGGTVRNDRVESAEQRQRDSDARKILEDELRRAEDQLDAMKRDYNNGEPERLGSEKNAQKYIDRVAEMKAAITRQEADVAAIRRELSKLPSS